MSQENLEIVRLAYEKGYLNRTADHPEVRGRVADGFRFHARRGFPGRPVYRLDEMTELWADLDATFTDYSLSPESYEALGEEYVLVRLRQSARLRGSNARLDETVYHLWNISGGKAVEAWTYGREAEALESAGLRA
jgi:hypothetical protein